MQLFYQFSRINPEILQSDILNSLCVEHETLILNIRILAAIWNFPNIPTIFFTFLSIFFAGNFIIYTLSSQVDQK